MWQHSGGGASAWVTMALVVLGCSSSDPTGGGRFLPGGAGIGAGMAAAGTSGAGAGQAGVAGTFDNSTMPPPPPAPPQEDAGSRCQEGVFCPPETVDGDECGSLLIESDVTEEVVPGNLLVVFDQSGSMGDNWGTTTKLAAAQTALVNALMPLRDSLKVGALFFPTAACVPFFPPPPGGAVLPMSAAGQISFRPGAEFITAWNAKWGAGGGAAQGIGTPLNEAMDRAAVALQEAAGTLTGQTAVMVFTDGAPNCFADPTVTMVPTQLETAHASQWFGATPSIPTYVVGLPGAQGAAILNDIAVAGGTMSYITPDDPAALEATLRQIVQSTVKRGFDSCTLNLTPPADLPDKLNIVVDEPGVGEQNVPRDLAPGSGWSITADGATVEMFGGLCEDAKGGRFASITFRYGCVELPPLEPEGPM